MHYLEKIKIKRDFHYRFDSATDCSRSWLARVNDGGGGGGDES